jgi:uncharacterized phage protein (TIGR01671 family)
MREILFRGKRKDNGEWAYGFYIRTMAFEYIYCYDREEFSDSVFTYHAIVPETVGQYTGLKDKDGRRIFEGDILRQTDGIVTHTISVRWCNERCGFAYDYTPSRYAPHKGVMTLSMYHFCPEEHEIIGNIHDAPELLKDAP